MKNPRGDVFNFVAYRLTIDEIVAKEFSQKFMSNTKWRKCFEILHQFGEDEASEYGRNPEIFQVEWKFVNRDLTSIYTTPHPISLCEENIASNFWLGPELYKAIEWIEVLRIAKPYGKEQYPTTFYMQDLEEVNVALNAAGKFEMEETESGLKIYGYK